MRSHVKHRWQGVDKNTKTHDLYMLREDVRGAIDDLILVATLLPEGELESTKGNVLGSEAIERLVKALLSGLRTETPEEREARTQRQRRLAALFMEKGIAFLLKSVSEDVYGPQLVDMIQKEALRTALLLKQIAIGPREGANIWAG
jgi:hypothetical protein